MYKYETVSMPVSSPDKPGAIAEEIVEHAKRRPNARLVHQLPITKPSTWTYGSKTIAIILTFETEVSS